MRSQRIQLANKVPRNDGSQEHALRELRTIPGVGKSISLDLWNLGIHSRDALRHEDPDELYRQYCTLVGYPVDRYLLYVFRCAVYSVSRKRHRPELLLWWNWKD